MPQVEIEGRRMELTHLDKIYWPDDGYTKGDLLGYYREVGEVMLPYLAGRPAVMSRYPHGITGEHFYQKDCPLRAPEWLKTVPVEHTDKTVNYVVHGDMATLLWITNLGAIEMHAWLSRVDDLGHPDLAVIDLDPAEGATFTQVVEVAKLARTALVEFDLKGYPKTSGATGLHLFIPLLTRYTFAQVTQAIKTIATFIVGTCPFATMERSIERRRGKVYVDYLQNAFGKSMAFPYSIRPRPGAPASTPLTWAELEQPGLRPEDFTLSVLPARLATCGDPYSGIFDHPGSLDALLALASNDNLVPGGRS